MFPIYHITIGIQYKGLILKQRPIIILSSTGGFCNVFHADIPPQAYTSLI